MTLMLHAGAKAASYDELRSLTTPEGTATHVPIPHVRVVDLVKTAVGMYGHEVIGENYGVTEDGNRFFGLLSLKSTYGDYTDTVGLRNSHDKSFPVSVGFGSRVFICDNLAFIAEMQVRRKHTLALKRDLPGLIGEMIEPLTLTRENQARTFNRYKQTILTDERADHIIMQSYRKGIINLQRVDDIVEQWDTPNYDEFADRRSAWRLFNAFTGVLTGRVVENPQITSRLHQVIDATIS